MVPLELANAAIRPVIVQRSSVAGALLALLVTCLSIGSIQASRAEGYPERTIRIVVPFPAGGPTDVAARLVAQSLSSRLGHNVIVENQAGAGGRIGAKVVATATADGYTLLLGGTNVNAITGAIYQNLGFDPIKSFVPVAMIYADSLALALSPRVLADTSEQLVKYAKDNPGKLKYGAPPGIYTHRPKPVPTFCSCHTKVERRPLPMCSADTSIWYSAISRPCCRTSRSRS
jgi:tripartite-type tricarboxylate transporter receptor subunit TctC